MIAIVFNRSALVKAHESLKMAQAQLAAADRRQLANPEIAAMFAAQKIVLDEAARLTPQAHTVEGYRRYRSVVDPLSEAQLAAEDAVRNSPLAMALRDAWRAAGAAVKVAESALATARAAQQLALGRQKMEADRKAMFVELAAGATVLPARIGGLHRNLREAARKGWLNGMRMSPVDPGPGHWDLSLDFTTGSNVPDGGLIRSPQGHIFRLRSASTGHCPSGACGKATTIQLVGWKQPKARRGIARSTELGVRPRLPGGWVRVQASAEAAPC